MRTQNPRIFLLRSAFPARFASAVVTALAVAIGSCAAGSPALAQDATPALIAQDATTALINKIARTYANDAVATGGSVGVEVGVFYGTEPPQFISAGHAIAGTSPMSPDSTFEIGSVTKVFTTNMLGQSVAGGSLALTTPLSTFVPEIGPLEANTALVTLEDLADFTGGFPNAAEPCFLLFPIPGCLPTEWPPITSYTGEDFADYFQTALVPIPPSAYIYSNFAIGLLGLLLGDPTHAPLSNAALTGWSDALQSQILTPLEMRNTCLYPPCSTPPAPIADGYQDALATATVAGGTITAITLTSQGALYTSAPGVTIVGGGGAGATAVSHIAAGTVTRIRVVTGGTGYIAPATVAFLGGGASTAAQAAVIVNGGQVVAIKILGGGAGGGAGYISVPKVMITGGRQSTGTDATAVAYLDNGQVSYVAVNSGGSGYVEPLAVIVEPGAPANNLVPIFAPAGSLKSTMRDLMVFAAAALGFPTIGTLSVPPIMTQGFAIAETPYACAASDPSLAACPPDQNRSALAWAITPADTAHGVPETVSKDGGIWGFSTELTMMPSKNLAVAVFANSWQVEAGTHTPTREAENLAHDILFALYYNLP
jgi:CubicO group peptidase (beta-lactamase class C family)